MIIKTLRRKFIAATMLSLAAVLLVILGGVNLMSYQKVISDADAIWSCCAPTAEPFRSFRRGNGRHRLLRSRRYLQTSRDSGTGAVAGDSV